MTNQEAPSGPLRRGLRTGRLEAFSDGVFAIAITLLVLDIAVPASAEAHLLRSVADLWPSPGLAGYVVPNLAGLFIPVVAVIGYLGIALFYVIPIRRGSRRFRGRHGLPQP